MGKSAIKKSKLLEQLNWAIQAPEGKPYSGNVFWGVDIGTANVVTVAVNRGGRPLAGVVSPAKVTKEGMIVDYLGAVEMVKKQVAHIQKKLHCPLGAAMSAIPPGTEKGNGRVTANILEAAGLDVLGVVNEPEAAGLVLGIENGAIVDVGGGTTGISIIKEGRVLYSEDEATGGFQFDLVIAGHFGIAVEQAEGLKKNKDEQGRLYPIVQPVMEKVASILMKSLRGERPAGIYLVGGACAFQGFRDFIYKYTGIPTYIPQYPLLVTPMGIALACARAMRAEEITA